MTVRDLTAQDPGALCFDPELIPGPRLRHHKKGDPDGQIIEAGSLIACPRWIQPTFDAVAECAEHGADIACLRGNRISALIRSQLRGISPEIRRTQFRRHANSVSCLTITSSLVEAKSASQLAILRRAANQRHDERLTEHADAIVRERRMLPTSQTIDSLRGREGMIARRYFAAWPRMLSLPEFQRIPRRAANPINLLLDLCYSRLCLHVTMALLDRGYDIALGALHTDDDRRPTLALDLMEPLRPLIADRFVLNCYRDALDGDWLVQEGPRWSLTPTGRTRWMKRWVTWMWGGQRRDGQYHLIDQVIDTYREWIATGAILRWPIIDQ